MLIKLFIGISLLLGFTSNALATDNLFSEKEAGGIYDPRTSNFTKTNYTTGNYLRLRETPTIDNNNIVTVLINGWEPITVIQKKSNKGKDWSMVETKSGEKGWLLSKYINYIDPTNTKATLESFSQELKKVNRYDNIRKERIYNFYVQYFSNGKGKSIEMITKFNKVYEQYYTDDLIIALVSHNTPLLVKPAILNNHTETIDIDQWYLNEGNNTIVPFQKEITFNRKKANFEGAHKEPGEYNWCYFNFTSVLSNRKVEILPKLSVDNLNKLRLIIRDYSRSRIYDLDSISSIEVKFAFKTNNRTFVLLTDYVHGDGEMYKLFEISSWKASFIDRFGNLQGENCVIEDSYF